MPLRLTLSNCIIKWITKKKKKVKLVVSYDSDESKDESKVESNSKNVLEGEEKRVNKIRSQIVRLF